jgi:hypothetical protein
MTTTISRLALLFFGAVFSLVSTDGQGTVNLTDVIIVPPIILPPRTNIWPPTPATIHFSNRVPQATPPIDAPIFDTDGITPLEGYSLRAVLYGTSTTAFTPFPQSTPLSDNFVAQVYAGRSADSLSQAGYPATFGTGTNAGYVREQASRPIVLQPPPPPIPTTPVLIASSASEESTASESSASQFVIAPPIYWPPPYYFPSFTVIIPGVEPGAVSQVQVRVWDSAAGSTYEEAVTYGGKHGASAILPIVTGGGTNPPAYLTGLESFHLVQGPPVSPVILVGPSNKTGIASQDIFLSVFARGTPPLTYQWSFNGYVMASQTNAVLWLPNFSANNAGQYQVRVSNHAGSIDSLPAALDLRVVKQPVILVQPPHRSVWIGRDTAFRVVTRGTRPFSYQWSHDGAVVTGGTNATLRLHDVELGDQGDYSVYVSNEAGGVWSDPAHLTVLDPSVRAPQILLQPQDQTVRLGTPVVFRVAAVGAGRLHYQWQHNGEDIPNARGPTFILKRARWPDTGHYTVVVRSDFGETASAPAWLGILDRAHLQPEIVSHPASQAVLTSTPISLRVRANGTPPLTYQWYFNNVPLPGATSSLLQIESAKPEHAGGYRVMVQNSIGGTLSLGAGVNVLYQEPQPIAFHGLRAYMGWGSSGSPTVIREPREGTTSQQTTSGRRR